MSILQGTLNNYNKEVDLYLHSVSAHNNYTILVNHKDLATNFVAANLRATRLHVSFSSNFDRQPLPLPPPLSISLIFIICNNVKNQHFIFFKVSYRIKIANN